MGDICKICSLPKKLCACDKLGCNQGKRTNCVTIDTKTNGITSTKHKKQITILRGVTSPQEVLEKLRGMFSTHGVYTNKEIRLYGDFSKKIRKLLHTSPSFFCF